MHIGNIRGFAMRTLSWVRAVGAFLAIGLVAAPAQQQVPLPSGGFVRYSSSGPNTRFQIQLKAGPRYSVSVSRDATVAANRAPSKVEVVAEVPGKSVILIDTYPSVPLGMSLCQAGEEKFLRIIALEGRRARQTLGLKIASCRDNIELADGGVQWDATAMVVHLHWLSGPVNKGKPEERAIALGTTEKQF